MLKKIVPVLYRCINQVSLSVLMLFTLCLSFARADESLLLDKVIATVNQELILYSDLEGLCQRLTLEGKVVDSGMKMRLLRELILNKLFLAEAKDKAIKLPKLSLQRECDHIIADLVQRAGSEEALVHRFGQSIAQIRKELKRDHKANQLALFVKQHLTQAVTVTPVEVTAYFNSLPAYKRPYCPTSFELYQLIIYPKIAMDRKEMAKTQLLQLKQLLLNHETTFAQLAQQYSDDFASAVKGGEVGWVPLGLLSPAYEKAALALKRGEISDPIASEYGFHLIELLGRDKQRYNTRHILKIIEANQAEIEAAKTKLCQIREEILAGKLTFQQAVERYSEDKEGVAQGGLLLPPSSGEEFPDLLCAAELLDPEVYFAIDGLEEGAVTLPECMGKGHRSACRLLYIKQKVEGHPMNLTQDYARIHFQLLQQKKQKAIAQWVKETKSKFVITLAPEYQEVEQLLE